MLQIIQSQGYFFIVSLLELMTVRSVVGSNFVSASAAGVCLSSYNAALCFTIGFSLPSLVVSPKLCSTFVTNPVAASLDSPSLTKRSIASGKHLFFLRLLTAVLAWPVLDKPNPFPLGTS